MSHYVHSLPGRLRVRIPVIKRNQDLASNVENLLRPLEGVQSTVVNQVTGSVVIHYDSKTVNSHDILNSLKLAGYYNPDRTVTNDQYVHAAASRAGHVMVRAVFGAVVEKSLESSTLSLLTVLI